MKEEILANLHDHTALERLYRSDKPAFKRSFNVLYPELQHNTLAGFWHERLNFSKEEISWGSGRDLLFVVIASVLAGLIAKLPTMLQLDEELFYAKNIGFIVFPFLSAWFAWKNKLSTGKIIIVSLATIASVVFINWLPDPLRRDTAMLSSIHLPLFLWSLLGFVFVHGNNHQAERRLGFLSFNGDLLVMTTLILIAGALLSALTNGLFYMIGIDIHKFYFNYVVVFGLSAAPMLGTYLVRTNPQLVGKVSPVIARIFSPVVLVMLVIYLIAMIWSGKNPYSDRDFLLVFNGLLVGVMAIIFFSVAEASKKNSSIAETWILLLLSVVTIIVNSIALSAILFRIAEWGITPNRAAVLGGNVLILVHLLLVTLQLFRVVTKKTDINRVGQAIAVYLPVYVVWVIIVTFIFPIIFGFR